MSIGSWLQRYYPSRDGSLSLLQRMGLMHVVMHCHFPPAFMTQVVFNLTLTSDLTHFSVPVFCSLSPSLLTLDTETSEEEGTMLPHRPCDSQTPCLAAFYYVKAILCKFPNCRSVVILQIFLCNYYKTNLKFVF